jgi:uncharacterized protein YqeY
VPAELVGSPVRWEEINQMSSKLLDQLLDDIKTAMKSRAAEQLTALRMLHAQIKDATVNLGRETTDEAVAAVVAKAVKQRQDAIEQYRLGGRGELADKEQREIDWIRKYQPEQLDAATLEALVRAAIAESGAAGKQDLGKVMKALMPKVKGRADGKQVNEIVQRLLA